ncbi:MAG: hypothetical protein EBU92_13860 [Betaproteobacteria bacterium]|nr:hypothetical protein [Betaproteobacteria bacterium]
MGATALPWTALDLAWLDFLKSHQASSDPLHDTLALLVSHQMGQGHACLDLEALWQAPSQLLGWTDLQIKSLVSLTEHSANDEAPADLFSQAHNPWALAAKTLPWAMGDHSPIVLALQDDGQALRVYLRRAWSAEQTIHSAIQHRLAQHFEVPHDVEAKLNTLFGPTDTSNNVPDWQRIACAKALRSRRSLMWEESKAISIVLMRFACRSGSSSYRIASSKRSLRLRSSKTSPRISKTRP